MVLSNVLMLATVRILHVHRLSRQLHEDGRMQNSQSGKKLTILAWDTQCNKGSSK